MTSQQQGWRDIASRPDEGTMAILWSPRDISHPLLSDARCDALSYEVAVFENGQWIEPDTGHSDFTEDWRPNPTHWMPLEPPCSPSPRTGESNG